MGVAELRPEHALLLFLHPTPAFHRHAHDPSQVVVGDRHIRVRKDQFQQSSDRLGDRGVVAPGYRSTEPHAALHRR